MRRSTGFSTVKPEGCGKFWARAAAGSASAKDARAVSGIERRIGRILEGGGTEATRSIRLTLRPYWLRPADGAAHDRDRAGIGDRADRSLDRGHCADGDLGGAPAGAGQAPGELECVAAVHAEEAQHVQAVPDDDVR